MRSSTAAPMSNYASPPNWPLDPNNGREAFTNYLEQFTALYSQVFTFPKPVVAALNGQAVALVGSLLSIPTAVVMPKDAPALKLAAAQGYGTTVLTYDPETERRESVAEALLEERGCVFSSTG